MKGASGKFKVHDVSSQAEVIRKMLKKADEEIMVNIVEVNLRIFYRKSIFYI